MLILGILSVCSLRLMPVITKIIHTINMLQYSKPSIDVLYKYFSDIGDKLYPRNTNVNSFIGASAAGILSYSAIYPLETVRSKLSVDITGSNKQYNSLLSTIKLRT